MSVPTTIRCSTMAELVENAPDVQASKKRGKYLPSEDLIIIREVAAVRAHVATYGNVRQSFEKVAKKVNQNPHMSQKVNWKAVQDRYKRLQDDFDADDVRNSNLSGVAGGEMGELYQALSQMREERETFLKERKADKTEKTKREEEKELMGRRVVEMALLRKTQRSNTEEEDGSSSDGIEDVDECAGGPLHQIVVMLGEEARKRNLTNGVDWREWTWVGILRCLELT